MTILPFASLFSTILVSLFDLHHHLELSVPFLSSLSHKPESKASQTPSGHSNKLHRYHALRYTKFKKRTLVHKT